ncbi:Protein kinase domain containing protein [Reticulomyxa filosa]|uniref:Protein kinase domain containing protein n=1 Tax=Reticulomyxa filosa TaxID=46433 RepID=X6LF56_RETFI|nr:Protein kinase domain containing protein [Reticulomyxa filosa]|eukprot:ETN99975.1 Protein kinase domain containing protein [Reticulomyxa filosa]
MFSAHLCSPKVSHIGSYYKTAINADVKTASMTTSKERTREKCVVAKECKEEDRENVSTENINTNNLKSSSKNKSENFDNTNGNKKNLTPLIGKTHTRFVNGKRYVLDTHYAVDVANPNQVIVGSGAYGQVCVATNVHINRKVAIKKISDAFADLIDGKRTLREVKMLSHFTHTNVIRLLDMIPPENAADESDNSNTLKDVYMVLPYMDTDLHKILRDENKSCKINEDHITYFMYQLLCGLNYIHSAGIIHRDIKPSNLLINLKDCHLKICDFGLSRPYEWNTDEMTEYVVTRWYRAPEIMLGNRHYDYSVDVWSLGCVFAELITKTPLFKGKNYVEQLEIIMKNLGKEQVDSADKLLWVKNRKAKEFMQQLIENNKRAENNIDLWTKILGSSATANHRSSVNESGKLLLRGILHIIPESRLTITEALSSKFFERFRNSSKEHISLKKFDFSYEDDVDMKSDKRLKKHMYDEILKNRRLYQQKYGFPSQ